MACDSRRLILDVEVNSRNFMAVHLAMVSV
jgi:hypothetical protein